MTRAKTGTSGRKTRTQAKTAAQTVVHYKTAGTSAVKTSAHGAVLSKLTVAQRRAQVVSQGELLVRRWSRQLPPEELGDVLQAVQRTLMPHAPADEAKRALAARLSGGRAPSSSERVRLELENKQRSFAFRRSLLEDALSASQVANLLGSKSRQTPHDRCEARTLLGVQDNGIWKFPLWQFDPQGPDGVVPGLPDVLRALSEYGNLSSLEKASFLTQPSPYLGGRTPLQALQAGEVDNVVAVARAVGVV